MLCNQCGVEIRSPEGSCESCGGTGTAAQPPSWAAVPAVAEPAGRGVDVPELGIFEEVGRLGKALAIDPSSAFGELSPHQQSQAVNIGAALCVLFAVTFAIGGSVAILRMPFGSYVLGSVGGSGVVVVLRLFLAGVLQSAAVACATLALRRYLRLGGGFGFDMLAAGASLVPIGVASLAAALVGFANFGLALGIVMSGAAYSVLILYSALAHLCCVPQKWLAPSVAIVIVVGAWIFKTAIFAFLM